MWEKIRSMGSGSVKRRSEGVESERKIYGGQEVPVVSDIECSNGKGVELCGKWSVRVSSAGRGSVSHSVSNDEFDESYQVPVSMSKRSQLGQCLKVSAL